MPRNLARSSKRIAQIFRFFLHPMVELKPRQFTIQIPYQIGSFLIAVVHACASA